MTLFMVFGSTPSDCDEKRSLAMENGSQANAV